MREFAEGQEIDQVLLVRGGPHPKLADRTGSVRASVAPGADCCLQPGSVVRVTGRYTGGELEVRSARAASEGEYDIADLLDGPPRTATGMDVTGLTRRYRIDGDTLTYELDMATSGTPMTRHLGATLRRVP